MSTRVHPSVAWIPRQFFPRFITGARSQMYEISQATDTVLRVSFNANHIYNYIGVEISGTPENMSRAQILIDNFVACEFNQTVQELREIDAGLDAIAHYTDGTNVLRQLNDARLYRENMDLNTLFGDDE